MRKQINYLKNLKIVYCKIIYTSKQGIWPINKQELITKHLKQFMKFTDSISINSNSSSAKDSTLYNIKKTMYRKCSDGTRIGAGPAFPT